MPIAISHDFIVGATPSTINRPNSIVALPDGRYAVVWSVNSGGIADIDINFQIFAANGLPTTNILLANTTTLNTQSGPTIAALEDGRFFATWYSLEGANSWEVRARIFNADGSPSGSDFVLNAAGPTVQIGQSVAALQDGRVAVIWNSTSSLSGKYEIITRIFNADGTPSSSEFVVNSPATLTSEYSNITAMSDGRFVVVWSEGNATTGMQSWGRIVDASGNSAGPAFFLNGVASDGVSAPTVATLANGNIVVAWSSNTNAPQPDIRARLLTEEGKFIGNEFVVNTITAGGQFSGNVAAMPDGRFVVTWLSFNGGSYEPYIYARIFAADGSPAGNQFNVSTTPTDNPIAPAVKTLVDGTLAFTWISHETSGEYVIRSTLVDPNTFQGTVGGDSWVGGSAVDTMFGYGGDDLFSGGAGEDYLNGGGGGDTLNGNAGNDRLEGGLSNDFLFGGADNDTLWGGQGIDTMTGGKGLDKFLYMNRNEAGDSIVKFQSGDKFVFDGQAFKLGTYAGKLKAANFKSGTTNKAADSNDFFIYRTTDDTLWFDADGKGIASTAIKIADLTNNVDLVVADILIV